MRAWSIIKYQGHNYIICEFDHNSRTAKLLRYTKEVYDRLLKDDFNVLYEHKNTKDLKFISQDELSLCQVLKEY